MTTISQHRDRRSLARRAIASVVTAATVVAIVLASAVGLDRWADDAAVSGAAAAVQADGGSSTV